MKAFRIIGVVCVFFALFSGCKKYEDFKIGDVVEFRTIDMVGTGRVVDVEEWVEGNTTIPYYKIEALSSDVNLRKESALFHPNCIRKKCYLK